MTGEFQIIAEGEEYIGNLDSSIQAKNFELMKDSFPSSFDKLREIKNIAEEQFKNMLQIDFTIENGVVYILNIHGAKMSPVAAVKVAVDMVHEKIMNERQAIKALDLKQLEFFLHDMISPDIDLNNLNRKLIGKGASISPGCLVGKVALTFSDILELKALNEKVIYCFDCEFCLVSLHKEEREGC
jgi:pyruvate,orthophosphate dikinase